MQRKFFQMKATNKQYQDLIDQINNLENHFKVFSNSELRSKIESLKKQYRQTINLNTCLPQSFALTREASRRTLGLRHFDVQLMGGFALNDQKIAEMQTGEGKTLVATLPTCLNALTNKGVHIVTVNDYLARRDQISMGQLYRFLGFNTGLIQGDMSISARKLNYNADITYVTNYELTFDYLRDNMALKLNDIVLRPFNYCIIDEVDSILIDEAQTPLIISNSIDTPVEKYLIAAEITNYLERNIDYQVDEKNKNIILTDQGSTQIETIVKTKDLYDQREPWINYILNAIKAKVLFLKNVHYVIQNNRIIIVDEFTGRSMPDRRWGDGLHQAVEAKENLPIRQKSETVATITYQNFFLLYPKLSGMTGTGKTAEIEFEKIYKLSVDEIPTAKPKLRNDLPDLIYKDQFSKWNAISQTCDQISQTGQPVLIGTTTVEKSEMLAQLLSEYNLSYQLLNAKPENVRRESEIVAQAGQAGAITIATNMAGRGTDIILGGNVKFTIQKELYTILTLVKNSIFDNKESLVEILPQILQLGTSHKLISGLFSLLKNKEFFSLSDIDILRILLQNDQITVSKNSYQCSIEFLINQLTYHHSKEQRQKNKIIKNLGGLYIVGTERNDSKRIDNQLRGRCGRQGDPGMSNFFLSLDDNLLRLFGGTQVQTFMQNQILDDSPLNSKFLTKSLDVAQTRIEERAYQQRKNLFDYDEILNQQRTLTYFDRRLVLNTYSTQKTSLTLAEQIISDFLLESKIETLNTDQLISEVESFVGSKLIIKYLSKLDFSIIKLELSELKLYLMNEFWLIYISKLYAFSTYGEDSYLKMERSIYLINIDRFWRCHLQELTILREAVGWRSYGQRNPLFEYRKEAVQLFEYRQKILREVIVYDLLRSFIL